jgi:hypothetical protein
MSLAPSLEQLVMEKYMGPVELRRQVPLYGEHRSDHDTEKWVASTWVTAKIRKTVGDTLRRPAVAAGPQSFGESADEPMPFRTRGDGERHRQPSGQ